MSLHNHEIGNGGNKKDFAGENYPSTGLGGIVLILIITMIFTCNWAFNDLSIVFPIIGILFSLFLYYGMESFTFWCNKNIWIKLFPKIHILSYFPDKKDCDPIGATKNIPISFRVTTNENFVNNMEALEEAGINYSVAADPRAIAIGEAVSKKSCKHDPIIFNIHENNVIIYDQIGCFASEKKIMKTATDAFDKWISAYS